MSYPSIIIVVILTLSHLLGVGYVFRKYKRIVSEIIYRTIVRKKIWELKTTDKLTEQELKDKKQKCRERSAKHRASKKDQKKKSNQIATTSMPDKNEIIQGKANFYVQYKYKIYNLTDFHILA